MNELNIKTANYIRVEGEIESIQATIDGTVMSVPLDTANRHYQAIQDWIAEGNTPAPADT